MSKRVDLKDKQFGRLKGIKPTGKIINHSAEWEFECKCGNKCTATVNDVMWSDKRSCGCLKKEEDIKHAEIARKHQIKEFGTDLLRITSTKNQTNNTSGIKGVSWHKKSQMWQARIYFQSKSYSLGYYHNLEEASQARKIAEKEIYGGFLEWYKAEYPERYEKIMNKKS